MRPSAFECGVVVGDVDDEHSVFNKIGNAKKQWHLVRFLVRASESMLASDPRVASEFGGAEGRKKRAPRLRRLFLNKLLPWVLRTYSPSYTPHRIPMPEAMKEVAERFTRAAISVTA